MANNTKFKGWTLVLNSVRTPLGFFTLLALILNGILLGTAALTNKAPMWAPIGLFGLLLVFVFAIVWNKPYVLYHPRDWQTVTVKLIFLRPDPNNPGKFQEIDSPEIDLDVPKCRLEVRDKRGEPKHKRKKIPNLALGLGAWNFQLIEDVRPSDSVHLELIEHNKTKWRVKPFRPYATDQKALPIR